MAMKVGIGEFDVIAFCPRKEKLSELMGTQIRNEIVYHSPERVKVVAVLKEVGAEFITFATFDIEKKVLKSKLKNTAFANMRGDIRWGKTENDLPSMFYQNGDVREVYRGEDQFLDFLKCYMIGADFTDGGVLLNRDKWFLGNFAELNILVNSKRVTTVGASIVIETSMDLKEKNKAWTRKFCPGKETEHFRNQVYGAPYLDRLRKQEEINKNPEADKSTKRYLADWETLLLAQNNPQYPCPYYYHNGYLKTYTGVDNLMRTNDITIR